MKALAAGIATLLLCLSCVMVSAQTATPPYYEEKVADSNPGRTAQAKEYDTYVQFLKSNESRLEALFKPDYRSERAYLASTNKLRAAFAQSIGYPPPGKPDGKPAEFKKIGEDSVGIYHRVKISILPGIHTIGLYIVPKGAKGRVPLIISMHGGGGSPEVATFNGGANYHDMVRGGVKRGYAVFAPQHLFQAENYPKDIRNKTDDRLRLLGTSITAVEIAKITRALDVILKRPEIDARRIAMVGLSYGGYYTLVTAAMEPRIKVSVSSCYFGVQEYRYKLDEASVPSDFRFPDRMSLFKDSELVALICPRPLEIQAGSTDAPTHRDFGKLLAPKGAEYYKGLGKSDAFRFLVFNGGHEFHDSTAWEFVKKHL